VGQVHDIEDLITGGKVGKICPYFSARELAKTAELVFCPYRCVVGRIIRL
jgi:Fanconi anemia group J protein